MPRGSPSTIYKDKEKQLTPLRHLSDDPLVTSLPLPTADLPPPAGGDYFEQMANVPTLKEFKGYLEYTPTGVHSPHIVRVVDSHGHSIRQLVKACDDLRQDAIMEQLFCLINGLLSSASDTHQRSLSLR